MGMCGNWILSDSTWIIDCNYDSEEREAMNFSLWIQITLCCQELIYIRPFVLNHITFSSPQKKELVGTKKTQLPDQTIQSANQPLR